MDFLQQLVPTAPRPGLHPTPGTTCLTIEAVLCPPLLYYLALLFLPPPPPPTVDTRALTFLRNAIALLAALLFFRLPLAYHVPQSIGLTYQLGLVGLYGGARVLDAFFISPYLFGHIPRRVVYKHETRVSTPIFEGLRDMKPKEPCESKPTSTVGRAVAHKATASEVDGDGTTGSEETTPYSASDLLDNVSLPSLDNSFFLLHNSLLAGPRPKPVLEHAISEDGWPHCFSDRASWALELELSMRGVGFTWSTADVRHTRKTWLPTVHNRLHSILINALPTLLVSLAIVRGVYLRYELGDVEQILWDPSERSGNSAREDLFDTRLPFPVQLLLTSCLGAVLMAAFSLAHSAFAILCNPLAPSPLAYFPPLYSVRIWEVRSVRGFWSYGWHRLFARFFLVYGIWPCEWVERKILGKTSHEPADIGKVMGAFLSSGFCHSFAARGVSGGDWWLARGEAVFFALNGVAVVVEEAVGRVVVGRRKKNGAPLERWYDGYVGRVWWISVLLVSGRNFARGWVNTGLVREMSAM